MTCVSNDRPTEQIMKIKQSRKSIKKNYYYHYYLLLLFYLFIYFLNFNYFNEDTANC